MFQKITDFENVHDAYNKARLCKRYRGLILEFGYNLEKNLLGLQWELKTRRYKHGGYREFVVTDSKKRTIKAAPFRDRVVHHALCNIIEPILDKGFIYDSYACRKGKGTHAAVIRLESFIKSLRSVNERERERETAGGVARIYCLKCDIRKYFDTIDHETLLQILGKKIKDRDILWLMREIVESNPQGIPIGNLTSQLFANVYLNELDHFVKRELKERYYIRYMDDFLILGTNKRRLALIKERVRAYLGDRLKLELHPKKAEVFPIDRGIDFLGYVIRGRRRFLRKSTVKRFMKKKRYYDRMIKDGKIPPLRIEKIRASWRGYAGFARASVRG
ncbi:MAG: group II intron reverse transcriptase domain-containing protein [Patescibacteria group bacterium]|nr:group II intron reverse transcriptase domain-containing protein [Patescibacteria group bacterium]